jgi:hypothetical protein
MINVLKPLEKSLEKLFVDDAPALPSNAKKFIVDILPWVNLVLGIVTLFGIYTLWHWAHIANSLINYSNAISAAYGGPTVANRLDFTIWLSMAVLLVEALLYIAAFPGTKDRKKSGWNFLFYAAVVNVIYGVVVVFTNYGGVGNLIGSLIGSAIGLYFLFQIRESYVKQPASTKENKA